VLFGGASGRQTHRVAGTPHHQSSSVFSLVWTLSPPFTNLWHGKGNKQRKARMHALVCSAISLPAATRWSVAWRLALDTMIGTHGVSITAAHHRRWKGLLEHSRHEIRSKEIPRALALASSLPPVERNSRWMWIVRACAWSRGGRMTTTRPSSSTSALAVVRVEVVLVRRGGLRSWDGGSGSGGGGGGHYSTCVWRSRRLPDRRDGTGGDGHRKGRAFVRSRGHRDATC
jgi:hypothetical protein